MKLIALCLFLIVGTVLCGCAANQTTDPGTSSGGATSDTASSDPTGSTSNANAATANVNTNASRASNSNTPVGIVSAPGLPAKLGSISGSVAVTASSFFAILATPQLPRARTGEIVVTF